MTPEILLLGIRKGAHAVSDALLKSSMSQDIKSLIVVKMFQAKCLPRWPTSGIYYEVCMKYLIVPHLCLELPISNTMSDYRHIFSYILIL